MQRNDLLNVTRKCFCESTVNQY